MSDEIRGWSLAAAETGDEAFAWATHRERASWAFRGQPDAADDNLRPSLFREHPEVAPDIAFGYECAAIEHFRRHATMRLSIHEQLVVRENILGSIALMRHYGAPTRLLDWTGNPLAALLFACADEPDKDALLWAFNAIALNEPSGTVSMAQARTYLEWAKACGTNTCRIQTIIPQYSFPLLTAQDGFFTIAPRLPADHAELLAGALDSRNRHILRIRASAKRGVLDWLHRLQMSPQVLFPSVDGVARHLAFYLSHLIELPTTTTTRQAKEAFRRIRLQSSGAS